MKARMHIIWTAALIAFNIAPTISHGAEFEKLTCSLFELYAELDGREISVSLLTDLPVNTSLMLSISRDYQQRSSREEYSKTYHSAKTIVGTLRRARKFTIDDSKWEAELIELQTKMARLGEGFSVTGISDHIEVSVVVPINQSDPRFGKGNANLVGCGISAEGLRVISREVNLKVPYLGSTYEMSYTNLDPRNLDVGNTYTVEMKTPLLPEHTPQNPLAALGQLLYLPPGGTIKILNSESVKGNTWYWVSANSAHHGYMGNHWINSTALVGQKLEIAAPASEN